MKSATLIILAAGLGSRYGSLKQIEPVGPSGEAIIDYSVYDALQAGFDKIVFVIKKSIEDDFKQSLLARFSDRLQVDYVFQELDMLPAGFTCPAERVKPWGTAHAVLAANGVVNTPFSVINADDYYGPEAFSEMYRFLTSVESVADYAMVGYRLGQTLSDHGSVSRGICEMDKEGYLVKITERTRIVREHGKIYYFDGDSSVEIPEDTSVSMNMWGFFPGVFQQIQERFSGFLNQNLHNPKAEFYIPELVDQLIGEGEVRVRVLKSTASWFGITYKEDLQNARRSIRQKIERGDYPLRLWE